VKADDTGPERDPDDPRLPDGLDLPDEPGLPDDADLSARLRELLERDAPPAMAVVLAKQSFGLRDLDVELAALVADSDVDALAVAVRADDDQGVGPRLLTFETVAADTGDQLAVELEVSGSGRSRRLLGQLHPPGPARIGVRQPSAEEPRWVDADDQGRFTVEDLRPGPFSLTCQAPGRAPVATAWTALD